MADDDQGKITSYDPSWTDWVAQKLLGEGRASPWRRQVVENVTGSTGFGPTGYLSAKDFVPVAGQVLNAQQAYHDDESWPTIALNLVPGMSTAGRQAILAEQAAARAAPVAADAAVDLARRSLFAPRPKAAEPSVTAPVTESAPADPTFLNAPVSRRAVNEGLAGVGAAAVLGPTFADDLLRKSLAPAADNVVVPAVKAAARATPEVIASKLKGVFHKPLDTSILERHIPKESWSDFSDPFDYNLSLADEGNQIELGHIFDETLKDPRVGHATYLDPGSYVSKKLAAIQDDYKRVFRKDLEDSVGHPITDEEFLAALEEAKKTHVASTRVRLESKALNDPDWGEHPIQDHVGKLLRKIAESSTSSEYPGYQKLMKALDEKLTPEGILKYSYGYPDEELPGLLNTVDKDGLSMRDHLQGIIDDAKDSGIVGEDHLDPEYMEGFWKNYSPKYNKELAKAESNLRHSQETARLLPNNVEAANNLQKAQEELLLIKKKLSGQ